LLVGDLVKFICDVCCHLQPPQETISQDNYKFWGRFSDKN